jgi:hypothetical protein
LGFGIGLVAGVLVALLSAETLSAQVPGHLSAQAARHPSLVRLLRWLDLVELHAPGVRDSPVVEVGAWSSRDLETLVEDLTRLSTFVERARHLSVDEPVGLREAREAARDRRGTIVLYNRTFSIDHFEDTFHGNQTLRRGAVLHADVGVFLNEHPAEKAMQAAHLVEDGRGIGIRQGSPHWRIGRHLLALVKPNPGGDAAALLWYRAVSAYLFHEGRLSELPEHLDKARVLFPRDPFPFLDSASLHQIYASPAIQAAVQDLGANNTSTSKSRWLVRPSRNSRVIELRQAENYLRDALARAPDNAEARIRLGQTLGELGRHKEAAAELRAVTRARLARHLVYLAELFLGREEEALRRGAVAERHYQNAATLYPTAQSPRIALSHLARQSGNRAAASQYLEEVSRISAGGHLDDPDPWWFYYQPHMDDADALMNRMRHIGLPR